jgi:mRNA interferase RelE/StbE
MIVVSQTFRKNFEKIDPQVRQRITQKIEQLDNELQTWRHELLQGRREYKLRVGDWRVLYDFDPAQNRVLLLTVRHRREVYR